MGEIKHGFTAGKMNKDLDERLVPQGQYRDANNIQIRTTAGDGDGAEGGEAGVIQNLQGNVGMSSATGSLPIDTSFLDTDFTCVGSISREKTDSAYFFFTSGKFLTTDLTSTTEIVKIDTIVEYTVTSSLSTPVVVDRWGLQTPIINVWGNNDGDASDNEAPTGTITTFNVISTLPAKIREGMTIEFTQSTNPNNFAKVKIKKIDGNTIHLYDQINTADAAWGSFTHARFTHPRALNFDTHTLITGINIIDNLLFWTDSITEPKKINIDRCKEGTSPNGTSHTKLFITNPNTEILEDAGSLELTGLNSDLLEEHITVLRPAPKTPPTIHTELRDDAELSFAVEDYYTTIEGDDTGTYTSLWDIQDDVEGMVGTTAFIGSTTDDAGTTYNYGLPIPDLIQIPFQIGDTFVVSQEDVEEGFTPVIFKVKFLGYYEGYPTPSPIDVPTSLIKVEIIKAPNYLPDNSMHHWSFKYVDNEDSKFELKFPRFGYRYKYEDGEYSAFSPWSELAFDPGLFDYDPVKGYNLGMVNTIKKITIKDFIPYFTDRALDITDIEILYKSTESPNVYTIKNIKKIRDGEWELFTPDGILDPNNTTQGGELSFFDNLGTGALEIKSEIIHRVVSSNQTLRTFDNVPRFALAQEITGSRILYGNFVQGFDIKYPVGLNQDVVSESVNDQPKRSVKTIRDYKVGMVFGDVYGRETPVIASNKINVGVSAFGTDEYFAATDELQVPKELCAQANKLSVKQVWDKPGLPGGDPSSMEWMEYVKYYVKETSNEYYNLVLDRWYPARKENNIWLSFPSADRNKVDLETYLYLKKAHGSGDAILDKARYKIIDIKAEAPDFIKTESRDIGLVDITGNPTEAGSPIGAGDPQLNEPFLLTSPTNTRIEVPDAQWQGFLNLYGENRKGQLFVRVVGRTENPASGAVFNQITSGDYKKVTHHYVKPDNENGVVTYESSFLGSADMVDRFAAAGYDIDGNCANQCLKYYFEFKEDVVENKPEFDGRFFVLIEKDETTEEMIELTTTNVNTYDEIDLITINYVDSQQYNPALQGPFSMGGDISEMVDIYGGSGLMTAFVTGEIDGESVIHTDPTDPWEWWGWGYFSTTVPHPTHTFQNTSPANYDSRQAHFFALGCNDGSGVGGLGGYNSHPINDSFTNYDDAFSNMGTIGTVNYAGITASFWQKYKRFHRFSEEHGYGNMGPDGNNLANEHMIFLDGARANQLHLREYGTDINVVGEQGTLGVYNGWGYGAVSNDSIAENGEIGEATGISVFNYKPTALDQGHADSGLGRMMLSKIGNWGPDSGNATAGAIWNYFAGPAANGTYFSFKDDESNDGEPYVYKVVTVHPNDSDTTFPVQTSIPGKSRNFGWLAQLDDNNWFIDYGYGGSNDTDNCEDTKPRSQKFGPDQYLQYSESSSFDETWGVDAVKFAGENRRCMDINLNIIPCWKNLDYIFNPNQEFSEDSNFIRIGIAANNDAGNESDIEPGDTCNHRYHRICGHCESESGGTWSTSKVCKRESIRFEFRRVDMESGEVSNTGIIPEEFDPRGHAKHDGTHGGIKISILKPGIITGGKEIEIEEDRAVWETEPKENVGLDLYYEATHALPMQLREGNTLSYAPFKSRVFIERTDPLTGATVIDDLHIHPTAGTSYRDVMVGGAEYLEDDVIIKVISTNVLLTDTLGADYIGMHSFGIGIGDTIVFEHSSGLQTRSVVEGYYLEPTGGENCTYVPQVEISTTFDYGAEDAVLADTSSISSGMSITGEGIPPGIFIIWDGTAVTLSDTSWITGTISSLPVTLSMPTGYYKIDKDVYKYKVKLGWHNCYSFGNGVESDRIRDDFNAPQIDNGVKVSTTINEYGKEDRSSSLIFSGLYNTTSGVNDLNEFNMGEKIIKDLNPEYGTVQALKTRDTDVVAFCEDRVLKVQANKEAVFMADNDPNIVATDRVLGTVSTFKGDYGISRSPESLASDQYRLYFTDSQRGAVLRLSMDGLTPISNVGMTTWFRDNIMGAAGYGIKLLGTFDKVNGEYNLSINNNKTISFNEGSKGWVSFKSFVPDQGVSVTGKYLTVKHGTIYEHYKDTIDLDTGEVNNRNLFYGAESLAPNAESTLTIAFNDVPSQVKSFKAMNYEGSQARIDQFTTETVNNVSYTDGEYYNLFGKQGWWVQDIRTDLQQGAITWFVDKENKWFNKISGQQTALENLDTSEFTVQGIGSPLIVTLPEATTDADGNDTTTTDTTTTNDDGTTDTTTTVDETTYTFTIMNNTENDND